MLKDADSYDAQFIRALFNRNKFEALQNLLQTSAITVYLHNNKEKTPKSIIFKWLISN